MTRARARLVGTHNLQDHNGRPSFFAAVVLFTEAIPSTLLARAKRPAVRLRGFRVAVCEHQPDLAIAYRKGAFVKTEPAIYRLAHEGEEWFTPRRGTYALRGLLDGRKTALLVEHRINKSFDPRADRLDDRERLWAIHRRVTLALVRELWADGYTVIAGGDLNTWPGKLGYQSVLREVGFPGLDRLGVKGHGRLDRVEHLSADGSDHRRLRARYRPTRPANRE